MHYTFGQITLGKNLKGRDIIYNIAIILGAGNGTRMGMDKSKMLIPIAGKTVIERSTQAFLDLPIIDEVIVVCRESDIETFSALLTDEGVTFCIGGKTRQESVLNAVSTIDECDYIFIHDGARPLVTENVILKTFDDAALTGAAATGVRVKDTIKTVDDDLNVTSTVDRNGLISIQTPQIFKFSDYKKALEKATREGLNFTDDSALLENAGQNVKITIGDYNNIKITTKSDIVLAENILKERG